MLISHKILEYHPINIALLSLILGVLSVLSFAPFDYWFFGLVGLGFAFLVTTYTKKLTHNFIYGLCYGLGLYGAGVSWVYVSIFVYGSTDKLLAIILTALFVLFLSVLFIVPFFIVYGRLSKRILPIYKPLVFASLWVLFEWFRTWIFTGFPWLMYGYSLIDTPVKTLAPILGVFGLSFVYAFVASTIASILIQNKRVILLNTVICMLIVALFFYSSKYTWTKSIDKPVSFSALQGNIDQNIKWQFDSLSKIIAQYDLLITEEWRQELIVLPENAFPANQNTIKRYLTYLNEEVDANNTWLIFGMPWEQDDQYFNSVMSISGNDRTLVYRKEKLVPFGEYVPFERWLRGTISFFNLPTFSFVKGNNKNSLITRDKKNAAISICYEIVYPDFIAKGARGSNFLINVTNDTWFGKSIGPLQHLQIARMRALETGRYLLRVANDGVTALINKDGQIILESPRYETAVLSGYITQVKGITPFMKYGSKPVLLFCFITIIIALLRFKMKVNL